MIRQKGVTSMGEMAGCEMDSEYMACTEDIRKHPVFESMDQYIQHGTTTCRDHCIRVSYLGYKICRAIGGNWRSAARAGLLHDCVLRKINPLLCRGREDL